MIAAVHGYCLGGGIDLITACDVRYASSGHHVLDPRDANRHRRRRRHAAASAGDHRQRTRRRAGVHGRRLRRRARRAHPPGEPGLRRRRHDRGGGVRLGGTNRRQLAARRTGHQACCASCEGRASRTDSTTSPRGTPRSSRART